MTSLNIFSPSAIGDSIMPMVHIKIKNSTNIIIVVLTN